MNKKEREEKQRRHRRRMRAITAFGLSVMRSSYSKGTGRLADETNTTLTPSVGMSYRFSEDLTGNINYQYTWYETDRSGSSDGYTRHNISTGLTYTF